jgi:hypothetical protein
MHPEDFVLGIIAALPERKIQGKKRLQKLAFLLKAAGAKSEVRFDIRDYGPFSREVASAAQFLTLKGRLEESEQPIGASRTFVTVYKVQGSSDASLRPLPEKYKEMLRRLDRYPTVDLEVAATFQFLRAAGFAPDAARRKTIELKPVKATPQVMKNVNKILESIHAA